MFYVVFKFGFEKMGIFNKTTYIKRSMDISGKV